MHVIRIVFILLFIVIIPLFYYLNAKNQAKLIPLTVLLGNPSKTQVKISPNGKLISYLAPKNGVLNVFIKSLGQDNDKPITNDIKRGVSDYFWSLDSKKIFCLRDKDGDENWHLYKVDLESGSEQNLTPFEGVKCEIIEYPINHPNKIIIGMNKRDKRFFDVYELNIEDNELKLLEENNENAINWGIDKNLNVKWALRSLSNGGYELLIKKNNSWISFITWDFEDGTPQFLQLNSDGKYIYIVDQKDSNTSRLRKINLDTKESTDIVSDTTYDVKHVEIDLNSQEPIAVNIYSSRSNWKILKTDFDEDFKNISNLDYGDFSISRARDKDDRYWIISYTKDNESVAIWFYDRETKLGKFLYHTRPELLNYKLANMHSISFIARDGVKIEGYITYPVNSKRKNLPLVLNVHGGPWVRDYWGFNPENQWMANRGYVVLNVNFRGSTGYGKIFKNLGDKQWGLNMQNDLTDAVNWVIEQKIADPKRIAIYGASYGGYATLCGAAFTPDLYCCAVDIVGPSNILTLIKSIPPYWTVFLQEFYKRLGNPETDKKLLESVSPLFSAHRIKIPILIAHGANDPRVKQAEAEQIVEALKKNHVKYKYLLFPDEGHGFYKAENRLKFYYEADKFLAEYLGGRSEK